MNASIIVVGAGIAGLCTALAAAPAPVLLLTRQSGSAGAASAMAQGGIAAALGAGDSAAAHAEDTLAAGSFHNDRGMVAQLTAAAADAIGWLQSLGVQFDREANGQLQLGREGGHARHRIVHAGGDATGAVLMRALVAAARNGSHIERRAGVEVDALLLDGQRVCGVGYRDGDGERRQIEARAVVLATGGIGGLFAHTSNPADADGSGLALAQAAGAALRDLEFVQFHPTALAVPGLHSLPLITEALRGAGARLLDAEGQSLMAGVHAQGDLAPRDVVARRVWQAVREGAAWLDARHLADLFESAFPTVLAACLAHGIDPRRQCIPVTPAAHFHMGGVAVDGDGRSSLDGLYAVGEVACTGVHGANRLASNSLLEGVVCGRRLGALLAQLPASIMENDKLRLIERGTALDGPQLNALRQVMWAATGPLRNATDLDRAIAQLLADAAAWPVRLALALLQAARRREHSLGAHWRSDAEPSLAPPTDTPAYGVPA